MLKKRLNNCFSTSSLLFSKAFNDWNKFFTLVVSLCIKWFVGTDPNTPLSLSNETDQNVLAGPKSSRHSWR